jgi:hypothetical protein
MTQIKSWRLLALATSIAVSVSLGALAGPAAASARPSRPAATSACPSGNASGGLPRKAPRTQAPRAVTATPATRARPPGSAQAFARDVLGEAIVPPGSVRTTIGRGSTLAKPIAALITKGLTDDFRAYKVSRSVSAVAAYEKMHLPRGARVAGAGKGCLHQALSYIVLLSIPVSGRHEYSASLAIGIVPQTSRSSVLRIDAQVVWVGSRPAAEKASPSSALQLTVFRSDQAGGGNVTMALRGAQERKVTSLLNSLPVGARAECAQSDPLYELQYTSARSTFTAKAYGCGGTITVAQNGKPAALLHDGSLSLVRLINGFLPAALRIGRNNMNTGNWAGWVSVNPPSPPGQYEVAFGEWTVPKVSCDFLEMAADSEWVGIDGFNESTVEQAGTDTYCEAGQGTYWAWWELFGTSVNGGEEVGLPGSYHVHPGDRVSVTVVAGHGSGNSALDFPGEGTYLFTIVNFTQGWQFQVIEPESGALKPSLQNLTAEWIVEQPGCFWACQALAQFGTVTFTSMTLTTNQFDYPFGTASPPSMFQGFPVNLVSGGTTKETGSALGGVTGNSETVTFLHK